MKNKAIILLLIPYIVLMILDIWSTLRLGPLAGILEANPLYNLIGFGGLIVLNVLSVWLIYFVYNRTKSAKLAYWVILVVFYLILTRGMVVHNNLQWEPDTLTIEEAKAYATPEAKAQSYKTLAFIYLFPLIIAFIPFLIWSLDYNAEKRRRNMFK